MIKPGSFIRYISDIPVGRTVELHLSGGQTLKGEVLENVVSSNSEAITIGKKYIGGDIQQMVVVRLSDVSAVTMGS